MRKMRGRIGLLGETLAHSYSPMIYEQLGIADYTLFPMPPEQVNAFLRSGTLAGLNVTIPYKKVAYALCDTLSPTALRTGNVNTLCFDADGTIEGHNTDYEGLVYTLHQAGISLPTKKVLILGTGGAAQTACVVAKDLGASTVQMISRRGADNYENIGKHADAHILINATPVGMYPHSFSAPVALCALPALEAVVDMVYNPLRTQLLQEAKTRGIQAVSGLSMLVEQARASCSLYCSRTVTEEEAKKAYKHVVHTTSNIVLVGMPGCGKTTVGKKLSAMLGRPLFDTDARMEEKTGRTPAALIAEEGEAAFRERETALVLEAAQLRGAIIATGGGSVLRAENRAALRQNGRVYLLDRALHTLAREGRPLSVDVYALYEARKAAYAAAADCTVPVVEQNPQFAADNIEEAFYAYCGD